MNWFTAILYFAMGVGAALITYLSTDDAVKYFDPSLRFKMIMWIGATLAGINNVKAFLSIPKTNGKEKTNEAINTPIGPGPGV